MKKYLMTGVAALAICAAFTSCSKSGDDLYNPEAIHQQKVDNVTAEYEAAFEKAFGKVGPNVDWGFSSKKAGTRSAYPNANQWASQGYNVPDPLTEGQKLRVQYYFQMNKITSPNRPDNGQIDFFMQQVYDGGTSPMSGKSPEKYLSADESTLLESGEHMDHLTAGPDHEHIYNFNNGTCSTNGNVGNNGAALDTDQHSDEIMLMLNTKTSCFGYANSGSSFVRDDRWTLVSAQAIDTYCDSSTSGFAAWLAAKGVEDKKVNDKWGRSFIGFDFDMLPGKNTLSGYSETKDANGEVTSWTADFARYTGNVLGAQYAWDGEKVFRIKDDSWNALEGYEYVTYNGNKIPFLKTDLNQYCGNVLGCDGENGHRDFDLQAGYVEGGENDNCAKLNNVPYNGQTYQGVLNLKWLNKMLSAGYYPVSGKEKLWVKVGGCADGYYSDWIVSFLPASSGEEIYYPRVIAEDLNAKDLTDFDFNDVVFDVIKAENGKTTLKLVAAGGIYPLKIYGSDGNFIEVHEEFGATADETTGLYPMINTGRSSYPEKEVEIAGTYDTPERLFNLRITVTKPVDDKPVEFDLTANRGKAACKILVDNRFPVVPERTPIANEQGNFTTYVTGNWKDDNEQWWWIQE